MQQISGSECPQSSCLAPNWSPLDAMFQDVVERELLSGAVTMVWYRGDIVHASAIGDQDVAMRTPMAMDSIFRLFSMTKPVTAVAMMILHDEGRWSPQDSLATHLPELADLQVFRGLDGDGMPVTSPPCSPVLLRHVMTHQAGFAYGFGDDPVDRAFRAARVPTIPHDLSAAEFLARLARAPLAFDPGTAWRYSIAMDVQGALVERLSGMNLRDFYVERIFTPLGMTDTDFFVPEDKWDRLASLYLLQGDTLVEARADGPLPYDNMASVSASDLILPYDRPPEFASGGGGLVSTAADYLRFGRMLLGGGELEGTRILSREAVAEMTRSHTPLELLTGEFGTAPHNLRHGYEYAYNGVVVTDPEAAGVALGRDTYFWDGAAGCWFWVDPANDVIIVSLIQLLADAERLGLQFRSRDLVADIISAVPSATGQERSGE